MNPEEVKKMKVPQLKKLLKAQGKPLSGTRAELLTRLETPLEELKEAREAARAQGAEKAKATRAAISPYRKKFENKNVPELKEELKKRGLKVSGNRAQLLRRLAYNEAGLPEPKSPSKTKGKSPGKGKPIVLENITISPRPTKGKKKSMSGNLPTVPLPSSRSTSPRSAPASVRSLSGQMTTSPSRRSLTSPRGTMSRDPSGSQALRKKIEYMQVPELKKELRKRNLSTGGEKPTLVNRLVKAMSQ